MFELTRIVPHPRFISLAVSAVVLGLAAGALFAWPKTTKSQKSPIPPSVTSKAESLKVISSELTSIGTNKIIAVKLQNVSNKEIKAYSIGTGKSWLTRNYMFGEDSLMPGQTVDQIIPLAASEKPADMKGRIAAQNLAVTGVLFEDGTAEGVSVSTLRLTEQYAGVREQSKRVLPCLRALASASETATRSCEEEISKLPTKAPGKSADFEGGLESVQREVLSLLTDLKEESRLNHPDNFSRKQAKALMVFERLAKSAQN